MKLKNLQKGPEWDGAECRPSAGQATLHNDGSFAEFSPIIAGQDIYHILDWLHYHRIRDLYRQAKNIPSGYVAGTVHRAVERHHHTKDANLMQAHLGSERNTTASLCATIE
jgi:hypothetical protein